MITRFQINRIQNPVQIFILATNSFRSLNRIFFQTAIRPFCRFEKQHVNQFGLTQQFVRNKNPDSGRWFRPVGNTGSKQQQYHRTLTIQAQSHHFHHHCPLRFAAHKRYSSTFYLLKTRYRPFLYGAIGVFGISCVAYLLFKTSLFMSSLTFKHVTYFGFYLGGITTAIAVLVIASLWRSYRGLHPDALYKDVIRRISRTPAVADKFGGQLSTGHFKAYARTGGLTLDTRRWFPRLARQPNGLQMMFQVNGPDLSAMCSVSATTTRTGFRTQSLALDFSDGQRYVLVGKPEDVIFKGLVRLR